MPGRTITLNYAGTCKECGTTLHPGARARYYGRGRVYGVGCHADTRPASEKGAQARTQDRRGLTLVSSRCEDYPCCGHGPVSGGGDGGPCPRVYEDTAGRQKAVMPCATCGSDLPSNSPSSLCVKCLRRGALREDMGEDYASDYGNGNG